MPSINLIAARREEKRKLENNIRRLVLVVAMEFGGVVFLASLLTVRLMTLRSHVDYLGNQVAQLQPKVTEIQKLEAQTAGLQPKVAVLNEARNTTLYWYTSIQTLSDCLPNHTWISGIDTGGDPTPPAPIVPSASGSPAAAVNPANSGGTPTLTFSGSSATSNEIGLAMLRMNQRQNIASVTLGSVTDAKQGNTDILGFSMTVALKPDTAQDTLTPGFAPQSSTPTAVPTPISPSPRPTAVAAIGKPVQEVNHV
jgi:Tfp pilus assembly protein PilN